MLKSFKAYFHLEPHTVNILLAEFFIQFVNSSFFLLLNYYMTKEGYADYRIADIVSYRFLAVMLFAFPLGLFIRGRKLKSFFYISGLLTPALALLIIYAIAMHYTTILYISIALWGMSFTCMQVTSMPFVLLNAKKETHSEAIALFFLCWSSTSSICGIINFFLNGYFPETFDEKTLLQIFAILGFASLYFIHRIDIKEKVSHKIHISDMLKHYDWNLILRATIPTLIIATGAGFTIPFINLFFLNVHHVEADTFSLMGFITYSLVMVGTLIIPGINRRFGYKTSITLIQSVSVCVLVLLATTEFYSHLWFAVYLAGSFFIIRQPLMNVAGPMTSELTMYYVGKNNQELMSALNASIWSGSWFISGQIFKLLRSSGMHYSHIFLITAALYAAGVLLYYLLILDYQKRKRLTLTDF